MKPQSSPPREALRRATDFAEKLGKVVDVHEFDATWTDFLVWLDRVWNKAEAYYCHSPSWPGWKGEYCKFRAEDPLLIYLRHARNTVEHRIEEIGEVRMGHTDIGFAPGLPPGRITIDRLVIVNGAVADYQGPWPLQVTKTPAKYQLKPVVNRGVTFNVPESHLGIDLKDDNAVTLASAGLSFYADFLDDAEGEFKR